MRTRDGRFARLVDLALGRAGITLLGPAQACVVVFDTTRWFAEEAAALPVLAEWEVERAARFRFQADRTGYVIAHALWPMVLAACLGAKGELPRVAPDQRGRPLLPDHAGYVTSLSRSGQFAAVAVARAAAIGVDIERFPPRHALDDVLGVIATSHERAAVARLSGEPRQRAMLGLWAAKEAMLKAWGVGLGFDPALVDTARSPLFDPFETGLAWRLHTLDLPGGLLGALAVPGELEALNVHLLDAS